MSSLILRTATRPLVPLLLLFSVFLLVRGHHEPGGGFVGGLVAATAFVLIALAEGSTAARSALRIEPVRLIPAGLATSSIAGLLGLLDGRPFLTGLWLPGSTEAIPTFGTPLLFDFGVYLTVAGVVLSIVFSVMEETR